MSANLQLFLRMTADGSALSRVVNRSTNEVLAFGRSANSAFTRAASAMRQLNAQLNGFSNMTRMAMGAGGVLSMRASINGAIDLEKAMLGVKANIMSGAGSVGELQKQLAEVRATARDISKQTIFSDADAVNMTASLLKSGVNIKDINGPRGAGFSAAALAQLGDLNPDVAASSLASIGNVFGFKSGQQFYEMADHLIKVDGAASTNPADLLYNFKQVGAAAAQLKIDPKRVLSATGYLDALGNMTGTSLNRFIEGLAGTTPAKKKALKESGLDFWQKNKDGTTTIKDFGTVIDMVRQKFQSMKSDREKLELGHKLFGEEGGRAAALFSSKDKTFAEFEAEVAKSATAADKLKVGMEGLGAQLSRLKNSTFAELEKGAPMAASTYLVKGMANMVEDGHLGQMIVGGIGAAMVARLGYKRMMGGGMGGMPGMPGMGSMGGAQPVFVTNFPAGGSFGGGASGGGSAGGRPGASGTGAGGPSLITPPAAPGKWETRGARFGSGAANGAAVGGTVSAVAGATEVLAIRSDKNLSEAEKDAQTGRVIAGTAGATAGAAVGGGIGALFGGVGAIPGAIIGGAIGNTIGEWLIKDDLDAAMLNAGRKKVSDATDAQVLAAQEESLKIQRQQLDAMLRLEKQGQRPVQVSGHEVTSAVNQENTRQAKRH